MLLRNHPLLTYRNNRKWPPVWLYCGGLDDTHPRGEVGILKTVYLSVVKPSTGCYLIMEHAGAEYMGAIYVSDAALCVGFTQCYFDIAVRRFKRLATLT
jgi:hypothetical protein